MTEKNADVEWLRERTHESQWALLSIERGNSILAHIDELVAEVNAWKAKCVGDRLKAMADRRPTVHEIAAQMMAAQLVGPHSECVLLKNLAALAYDAAEALIAEGRRRDEQS